MAKFSDEKCIHDLGNALTIIGKKMYDFGTMFTASHIRTSLCVSPAVGEYMLCLEPRLSWGACMKHDEKPVFLEISGDEKLSLRIEFGNLLATTSSGSTASCSSMTSLDDIMPHQINSHAFDWGHPDCLWSPEETSEADKFGRVLRSIFHQISALGRLLARYPSAEPGDVVTDLARKLMMMVKSASVDTQFRCDIRLDASILPVYFQQSVDAPGNISSIRMDIGSLVSNPSKNAPTAFPHSATDIDMPIEDKDIHIEHATHDLGLALVLVAWKIDAMGTMLAALDEESDRATSPVVIGIVNSMAAAEDGTEVHFETDMDISARAVSLHQTRSLPRKLSRLQVDLAILVNRGGAPVENHAMPEKECTYALTPARVRAACNLGRALKDVAQKIHEFGTMIMLPMLSSTYWMSRDVKLLVVCMASVRSDCVSIPFHTRFSMGSGVHAPMHLFQSKNLPGYLSILSIDLSELLK